MHMKMIPEITPQRLQPRVVSIIAPKKRGSQPAASNSTVPSNRAPPKIGWEANSPPAIHAPEVSAPKTLDKNHAPQKANAEKKMTSRAIETSTPNSQTNGDRAISETVGKGSIEIPAGKFTKFEENGQLGNSDATNQADHCAR